MATSPDASVLTAVLASNDPTSTLGATALALGCIDQQVAAIQYHSYSGFTGADQMSAATGVMQAAAGRWPATRASILAAANLVVGGAAAAAQIGTDAMLSTATPGSVATSIGNFRQGPLAGMINAFGQAKTACDGFDTAMSSAASSSAGASSTAAAALMQAQISLQMAEHQLKHDEDKLHSAGSIILGIVSLGIYTITEIKSLQQEIDSLNAQSRALSQQELAYSVSLGSFQNAVSATKQASYAIGTVTTALQQLGNSLDDIINLTSPSLVVMQAYAKAFSDEFAGAVAEAKRFPTS